MSKAVEVFRIPELMEMILLLLPNKNLIGAKRTCSAFATSYDTSVKIQRKLFMKDAPWPGCESAQENVYDSSLPGHFFEGKNRNYWPFRGQKMHLNPLCFKENCLWTYEDFRGDPEGVGPWVKTSLEMIDKSRVTPESSCNKMLAMQRNIPVTHGVSRFQRLFVSVTLG